MLDNSVNTNNYTNITQVISCMHIQFEGVTSKINDQIISKIPCPPLKIILKLFLFENKG